MFVNVHVAYVCGSVITEIERGEETVAFDGSIRLVEDSFEASVQSILVFNCLLIPLPFSVSFLMG